MKYRWASFLVIGILAIAGCKAEGQIKMEGPCEGGVWVGSTYGNEGIVDPVRIGPPVVDATINLGKGELHLSYSVAAYILQGTGREATGVWGRRTKEGGRVSAAYYEPGKTGSLGQIVLPLPQIVSSEEAEFCEDESGDIYQRPVRK